MAVNQAHVDHTISTESADDPEVRLLKLQDEVDLLKTSIKRLLIDIRERMNDVDNPFNIHSVDSDQEARSRVARAQEKTADGGSAGEVAGKKPGGSHPLPAQDTGMMEAMGQKIPEESGTGSGVHRQGGIEPEPPVNDADFVKALKMRIGIPAFDPAQGPMKFGSKEGKVRLQKVFRLFAWTTKNVKKYGHDRTDLMLESYRAMGYISSESCTLVKDIARLMPNSIGEEHDINAAEYVKELYELNNILNPGDDSLDQDMIEVFMHQRASGDIGGASGMFERTREDIPSRDMAHKKDRV
ncbi:MAG: hypothetical protein WBJ52_01380 [Methanoregulaceae archaeon]